MCGSAVVRRGKPVSGAAGLSGKGPIQRTNRVDYKRACSTPARPSQHNEGGSWASIFTPEGLGFTLRPRSATGPGDHPRTLHGSGNLAVTLASASRRATFRPPTCRSPRWNWPAKTGLNWESVTASTSAPATFLHLSPESLRQTIPTTSTALMNWR